MEKPEPSAWNLLLVYKYEHEINETMIDERPRLPVIYYRRRKRFVESSLRPLGGEGKDEGALRHYFTPHLNPLPSRGEEAF